MLLWHLPAFSHLPNAESFVGLLLWILCRMQALFVRHLANADNRYCQRCRTRGGNLHWMQAATSLPYWQVRARIKKDRPAAKSATAKASAKFRKPLVVKYLPRKISVKDPIISVEMSRNQVKAWTGYTTPGEYKIFNLNRTTVMAAKTESAKWLIAKLKEQKRKPPPAIVAYCK